MSASKPLWPDEYNSFQAKSSTCVVQLLNWEYLVVSLAYFDVFLPIFGDMGWTCRWYSKVLIGRRSGFTQQSRYFSGQMELCSWSDTSVFQMNGSPLWDKGTPLGCFCEGVTISSWRIIFCTMLNRVSVDKFDEVPAEWFLLKLFSTPTNSSQLQESSVMKKPAVSFELFEKKR